MQMGEGMMIMPSPICIIRAFCRMDFHCMLPESPDSSDRILDAHTESAAAHHSVEKYSMCLTTVNRKRILFVMFIPSFLK
jgi:hypothetical protein